jgi:hypothetical protein
VFGSHDCYGYKCHTITYLCITQETLLYGAVDCWLCVWISWLLWLHS